MHSRAELNCWLILNFIEKNPHIKFSGMGIIRIYNFQNSKGKNKMKTKVNPKEGRRDKMGNWVKGGQILVQNINYDCRNECRSITTIKTDGQNGLKTRRSSYMLFNRQYLKHKDLKKFNYMNKKLYCTYLQII